VGSDATTCKSRDILSSRLRVFLLYWLPAIAIVVAGVPAINSGWRTVVWTGALGTMGVACIVNALRCGRVHCYLTGPFFLLVALVALSYGLGILRLGGNGWNLLGLITLIGAIALWYLPEMFFGKISEGSLGKRQPPLKSYLSFVGVANRPDRVSRIPQPNLPCTRQDEFLQTPLACSFPLSVPDFGPLFRQR